MAMKDLVILVADKNAQFALKGALGRPEALGIGPIEYELSSTPGAMAAQGRVDRKCWHWNAGGSGMPC